MADETIPKPAAKVETKPVEKLNQAGTAPAVPDQPTVADAHATYEERLARAKAVEAAKWGKVAAGAPQREAKAEAVAENKARAAAPENKGA
jgi:hypothetical protein